MAKNVGKIFEDNFKKSIPENIMCYRPPDAAQSFNMDQDGQTKLRFSRHSPCDFMIFNGNYLFCLELKSVGTKSISFEMDKTETGTIHYYQTESLTKFARYKNIMSGFIFDFRLSDKTYYMDINTWNEFSVYVRNVLHKKSFNEDTFVEFDKYRCRNEKELADGLFDDITMQHCVIGIEKRKLKVNYKYNVEKLLSDIIMNKFYSAMKDISDMNKND